MSGLACRIFRQVGTEVGDIGRDQFVADQFAAVAFKEIPRRAGQVMAEKVVCGQRIELLALHHVVAHQRLAGDFIIITAG